MATIHNSWESERGCGYRKGGGLYFVGGESMAPCGMLPLLLDRCPTCDHGIKPSRGWTWINIRSLIDGKLCSRAQCHTSSCALHMAGEREGLLWIGEKFYPTPYDFLKEGAAMGFSRRVKAIPHDFELTKTRVFFAHRKAITGKCGTCNGETVQVKCDHCNGTGVTYSPGIFSGFLPTAIEYVVTKAEAEACIRIASGATGTDEDKTTVARLDAMEKRGFRIVRVFKEYGSLIE